MKEKTRQIIFSGIASFVLGLVSVWLVQFVEMGLDKWAVSLMIVLVFLWYQTFMRYFERQTTKTKGV